jgi:phasin family protein
MSIKPKAAEAAAAVETPLPAATPALLAPAATKAAEATVSGIRDGMEEATAAVDTTQVKMKQGMEKAMKTAEEFVAFGQGNVEAFVKSSQIWTAGAQDLSKQVAATAQSSFDDVMTTFKAMSSVKSLKDMFDLQANFARATLEKTMSESGKLTEASFKLTEQALAPITARMTLAVEKLAKAG